MQVEQTRRETYDDSQRYNSQGTSRVSSNQVMAGVPREVR